MKRIITGICILLILLTASFISLSFIGKKSNQLSEKIDEISTVYRDGNAEEAKNKTQELELLWEDSKKPLNIFVNSNEIIEIQSSVMKIRPYIETENDEIYAELESLKTRTERLYNNLMPYWYNIL
jgi:hypothetical protein